jgi:hypothetical protein
MDRPFAGLSSRRNALDPIKFARFLWPDVTFYPKQEEIIYSVVTNDETVVTAGHMLGKDFVAGFIALWFFLSRHPCRVITTSADYSQLESVLWGEIRRFIQTAKYPLEANKGGPLVVNHLHIKKMISPTGTGNLGSSPRGRAPCGISYIIGRVAAKGEGMQGHHVAEVDDGIPRTLYIADEASGVEDNSYEAADTWTKRKLIIGNPYPCTNFFRRSVKEGDMAAPPDGRIWSKEMALQAAKEDAEKPVDGRPARRDKPRVSRLYRKIIQIRAVDSPNVQAALIQQRRGLPVTGKLILPGVLPWTDYQKRLTTWDPIRIKIGLEAEFYEGAETLLYPPVWLDRAHYLARMLAGQVRQARAIGVDPAEGGDRTVLVACDEYGLIELESHSTPDTAVIKHLIIKFAGKHGVPSSQWFFCAGGGGHNIADSLREMGYYGIRAMSFGSQPSPQYRAGVKSLEKRQEEKERRQAYKNLRAELYGTLRILLDPSGSRDVRGVKVSGFALPEEYTELRRQLSPLPLLYTRGVSEGVLYMPPKRRQPGTQVQSIEEIIGCSPDEADALCLGAWGATNAAASEVEIGAL